MKRRLNLHKETLAPIGSEALSAVAGGTHFCTVTHTPACTPTQFTCITVQNCLTLHVECPTDPVVTCICIQTIQTQ